MVPDGEEQAKAHEKEIELYKEILNMPYKVWRLVAIITLVMCWLIVFAAPINDS